MYEHRFFPTKIPIVILLLGCAFIVWSIVNLVEATSSHTVNLASAGAFNAWDSLVKSMVFLHFILGVVLILNGMALSKINKVSKSAIERLHSEIQATNHQ